MMFSLFFYREEICTFGRGCSWIQQTLSLLLLLFVFWPTRLCSAYGSRSLCRCAGSCWGGGRCGTVGKLCPQKEHYQKHHHCLVSPHSAFLSHSRPDVYFTHSSSYYVSYRSCMLHFITHAYSHSCLSFFSVIILMEVWYIFKPTLMTICVYSAAGCSSI